MKVDLKNLLIPALIFVAGFAAHYAWAFQDRIQMAYSNGIVATLKELAPECMTKFATSGAATKPPAPAPTAN